MSEILIKQVPIDAFELELRIRNNAIKQRREMLGLDQEQLAARAGISRTLIAHYETLRATPKDKKGAWKSSATILAAFFGVAPEVLWPDVVQAITQPVLRRKAGHREVERLYALERERILDQHQLADPECRLLLAERSEFLKEALSRLGDRDRTILELRYGLNGDPPMTYAMLAKLLKVTAKRIRQIERRAWWKIRAAQVRQSRRRTVQTDRANDS